MVAIERNPEPGAGPIVLARGAAALVEVHAVVVRRDIWRAPLAGGSWRTARLHVGARNSVLVRPGHQALRRARGPTRAADGTVATRAGRVEAHGAAAAARALGACVAWHVEGHAVHRRRRRRWGVGGLVLLDLPSHEERRPSSHARARDEEGQRLDYRPPRRGLASFAQVFLGREIHRRAVAIVARLAAPRAVVDARLGPRVNIAQVLHRHPRSGASRALTAAAL